jgi:iron complex outermembrane receptor protein
VGNPGLGPEKGRTTEVGLEAGRFSFSVFSRRANPIIDYVLGEDEVWRASNIGRVTTRGVEAALFVPSKGDLLWQRLGLAYLDSSIEVDPVRSAYALAHPKIEAAWTGAVQAGYGFEAGWAVRWRDPVDRGSWVSLDLRLDRRILKGVTLSLEATNLFDRQVSELHGIPLPGRWLSLTARYRRSEP